MTEQAEFEANFPAHLKGTKESDGTWTVVVTRKSDNKTYPVTILKGLSANDCYVRLGVKVVEEKVPESVGVAGAKEVLSQALTDASGRTIFTATEVQDVFLDMMNKLGWDNDEPN